MVTAVKIRDKDTKRITIRVDTDTKKKAEELFERLGIDMNTAFNIFLCAVVNEQGIPFAVSLNSASSVTNCLPDKIKKAELIARYNSQTKKAYLYTPDGDRVYI